MSDTLIALEVYILYEKGKGEKGRKLWKWMIWMKMRNCMKLFNTLMNFVIIGVQNLLVVNSSENIIKHESKQFYLKQHLN